MKFLLRKIKLVLGVLSGCLLPLSLSANIFINYNPPSINQTPTVSPVLPSDDLPFQVSIEQAGFQLPNGVHSGVFATYKGLWLLLAGRTNGMHTFNDNPDNFPPQKQNRTVYVVDPSSGTVYSRALDDAGSGLKRHQIDLLAVTSPQYYQTEETLYMTGGYGIDFKTGHFSTKDALTAINIKGLIHWVMHPGTDKTAAQNIRQIFDPIFQITGGVMYQLKDEPTLLIFGQNFTGFYLPTSSGVYSEQVRRFHIIDDGVNLSINTVQAKPKHPDPNYRRRDLNVLPTIYEKKGILHPRFVAFSGVFTPLGGMWTIPVDISASGSASMKSPASKKAFRQAMNNYACATTGLYSQERKEMFNLFFGGISFGYFENGAFVTDIGLPFINQVTTVRINKHNEFEQFIMNAQYPVIPSTGSNPGNPLLFGAGAFFIPNQNLPTYSNGVLKFDKLRSGPRVLGYIVGGIASTLQNTNTGSDSTASTYIFKVTLTPTPL